MLSIFVHQHSLNHKVNNEFIPPVKLNETFTYLGKTFSFIMSVDKVESELISGFNSYLDTINRLPLHPKNKLNIVTRYVYSKVRWRFCAGFIYPKMLT